ncbi:acetamidase/formamidase family protein [uncultured Campylobacter sp.]|uniref:acetamidase/formamidase family protein n=1 Tax=uncultured Campylobacter sp. TaxID=218934 RepID=UPI00262C47E0|nr:acetamidase/formamidase family protein [uncultured Campylobacter sp.]
MTLTITAKDVVYKMDKSNHFVARANSGDRVIFETLDCFSCELKTEKDKLMEIDFNKVNPATGPLFINEAKAGDVLKIYIEKIEVKSRAVTIAQPGFGRLGNEIKESQTAIIEIENNKAKFKGIELPLRKMIGVIATAPLNEPVGNGTPGDHGGNMDCKEIKEGAILYLPVFVDGALLALGDLHALMGDGEINGAGAEVSGRVTIRVEVLKECNYPLPMIETKERWMTIGSRKSMDEASDLAILNMQKFIQSKLGLSGNEAAMLMSIGADLAVCQVVNENKTMRVEIDKELLKS